MTNPPSTTGHSAADPAKQAAASADAAIGTVRDKAGAALDGVTEGMQAAKDKAAATLERFRPQLDSVSAYAREEPTKALLIAAAAGAGLMALITLTARSSHRLPSARGLGLAAASTADEWRKAAARATDGWRKAAEDATAGWRKSTTETADDWRQAAVNGADRAESAMASGQRTVQDAYEGLSDTVNQWKDQAATLVDRVRPQLESVTAYAKDDPAKAMLIAAVAGAALMGILNARNR